MMNTLYDDDVVADVPSLAREKDVGLPPIGGCNRH
jgi:hypothetical protein